jgi:hypothetical protein
MSIPHPTTQAGKFAASRSPMPTSLGMAGLRELDARLRYNSTFLARGTNIDFVSRLHKMVVDMAEGNLSAAQVRTRLLEMLKGMGYTPEGGFPGDTPVPPATPGSLQDLSSFQRLNLIAKTQLALARGAGLQTRGQSAARIRTYPAWELIRLIPVRAPRNWKPEGHKDSQVGQGGSRWLIAGGKLYGGRMIAFKGDPIWGELGSSGNFSDALDVDFPPFCFNSGMFWNEVSAAECKSLGVQGPSGEAAKEWFAKGAHTIKGPILPPAPAIGLRGVSDATLKIFKEATGAESVDPARPDVYWSPEAVAERSAARLREALEKADAAYNAGGAS